MARTGTLRHLRGLVAACAGLLSAAAWGEPAAWHVAGADGGEAWLLGSVHYLREEDYPLPAIVDELYARADTLVMELDLDDLDAASLQAEFLGAAMLPSGTVLEDVLDPMTFESARTRARELGIDLSMLGAFEPWLVAVTLLDLGMARAGYRPEHGIEQYLLSAASADTKPILGLETAATQIAVFDELDPSTQESLLEQTLAEIESPSATMREMVSAWRDGRLADLSEDLIGEFAAYPDLYEAIVVERNEAWVEVLADLLTEPTQYLVVVGALHLVGGDSLIELLRAQGYSVTPL